MKVPLYEQIYSYILEEVRSGRLRSGDLVPSENELAKQFNVSRITSKKALETLAHSGIIERSQGKGSFVAQQLPDLNALTQHDRAPTPPRNTLIGVVFPSFSDSYGLELIYSIESYCTRHDAYVILKLSHGQAQDEEEAVRSLVKLGIDGLLLFPARGEYYNAEVLRLVLNNFPVVFIDRFLKGIAASTVRTDNRRAAHEITELLLKHGHRHIAFVCSIIENNSAIEERLQGFNAALSQYGIPANLHYVFSTLSLQDIGVHQGLVPSDPTAIREFFLKNPDITAFVAGEYEIAVGIHQALSALGKDIPGDIEIVCFDSPDEPCEDMTFSHVRQSATHIAETAVELLLDHIHGDSMPRHILTDFTIVSGNSSR